MALMKFTQPQLNVLRSLLTQDGWAKDFGDFYDAGKALSEWPKEKYLPQTASAAEFDALLSSFHEIEVGDKTKAMVKKALGAYVAKAGSPTQVHFEVMQLLGIDNL